MDTSRKPEEKEKNHMEEEEEKDDDPFFAEDSDDPDAMAFLEELDLQMRESDKEALERAYRHFWITGGILIVIVLCYTMILLFH